MSEKNLNAIEKVLKIYEKATVEITDETAMSLLNTKKRNDYLNLLNIAGHPHIGKSRAILTAFKPGYLRGKTTHKPDVHNLEFLAGWLKFVIVTKDGTVVKIGRSQIIQPQIMYKGNGIKWLDDNKYKKIQRK